MSNFFLPPGTRHSPGDGDEEINANMIKFTAEAHGAYSHYRKLALRTDQKSVLESIEDRFFRHTYDGEDESDDSSDDSSVVESEEEEGGD